MKGLARNTRNNRRWYGGGIPVAVEPHKFWPMNDVEKRAAGFPKLSLHCRECGAKGLFGRDGHWRHALRQS